MPDLFLSYARDDQDIARRFAENLEREGFAVWWDQALNPGEAFDQVTEEALAAASAVIVLWSKTSVSSRWVRAEATQANASHRLLPVMIEPCTRPIMFELTHTADLSGWKGNPQDPRWQSFVASVRRFMQKHGSGESALAPQAAPRPTFRDRFAAFGAALGDAAGQAWELLRRFASWITVGVLCAAMGGVLAWQMRRPAAPEVTRFSIDLGANTGGAALSPDGRRIVFESAGKLYSRRLDKDEAIPIPGGEGGSFPFFSPDSRSIAYFAADGSKFVLRVFDFAGESTRIVARNLVSVGTGVWGRRGHIYFRPFSSQDVLQVPVAGGEPGLFAPHDKYQLVDASFVLPVGDWLLLSASPTGAAPIEGRVFDVVAQNTVTGERKLVLHNASFPQYLPTGHLLFGRGDGAVYAIPFDARRAATRGNEMQVVQGVFSNGGGFTAYLVADDGTLVYQPGSAVVTNVNSKAVVRVTGAGAMTRLSAEPRNYSNPRASPDGSRIAVEVLGADNHTHIWIMDAGAGTANQLTFDGDEDRYPVWTSDGKEVLYTSRRGKEYALWRKAADGGGESHPVLAGTDALVATDVNGESLAYHDRGNGGMRDLFILNLASKDKPRPLVSTPEDEFGARISPDGRWIAYVAITSGDNSRTRTFVRPFPDTAGGQRAVSEDQGVSPLWSASPNEIYYLALPAPLPLTAVTFTATQATFTPMGRRKLFDAFGPLDFVMTGNPLGPLDLATTGNPLVYSSPVNVLPKSNDFIGVVQESRLLESGTIKSSAEAGNVHLNVVLNWAEELKQLVPAK